MSSEINLYQSPQAPIDSVKSLSSPGVLTDTMVFYLKESAPWLRFIGILGYIASAITVLFGIIIVIITLTRETYETIASLASISGFVGITGGFAGFNIIIGTLMFFPARFTYNFGARIRNFIKYNTEQELELAFKNNRSLWKFTGIMILVAFCIPVIGLIINIIILVSS